MSHTLQILLLAIQRRKLAKLMGTVHNDIEMLLGVYSRGTMQVNASLAPQLAGSR